MRKSKVFVDIIGISASFKRYETLNCKKWIFTFSNDFQGLYLLNESEFWNVVFCAISIIDSGIEFYKAFPETHSNWCFTDISESQSESHKLA